LCNERQLARVLGFSETCGATFLLNLRAVLPGLDCVTLQLLNSLSRSGSPNAPAYNS
jgi:hypothetical protein